MSLTQGSQFTKLKGALLLPMANKTETCEGQILIKYAEDDSCESYHSCSSSIAKYSDESFASYTDENEESRQSYSQSFESYHPFNEDFEPNTESETTTIKSEVKSLSPSNFKQEIKEEFECCEDPEDLLAKENFIEKRIGILNSKRFDSTPLQDEKCVASQKEATQSLPVESAPLQIYYCMKIDQIQQQLQAKKSESYKHGKRHSTKPLKRDTAPQQSCIVPQHLINQVRLNCISETVKQIVETSMHQPSECAACLEKVSKLAEHNFLRVKKVQLEEASLQEKLEEHIYTKDPLTQIGEINSGLPKYSDTASLVWKRLFNRNALN
ncbi:uncharacterized protein C8orf48-like isoform X1 [Carcharodon carcharias]|uniref:uncharacterized protein C8orf48-like isoform X1 n=2 Tax=Carcharodon carcharias TaxID=13397 RepID=UPI001B7E55B0|nr:uncharacterized protein C8orf48-like isoform X1 [Carcharodon carcharias]